MSSEPSSGVICDEDISSESSSSMFVSLPDVSAHQDDSAVDVLLPRDHIVEPSSTAYGTISTYSSAESEQYFRDLTQRLCLLFAILVIVLLFSVPVAYRFVSKDMYASM